MTDLRGYQIAQLNQRIHRQRIANKGLMTIIRSHQNVNGDLRQRLIEQDHATASVKVQAERLIETVKALRAENERLLSRNWELEVLHKLNDKV